MKWNNQSKIMVAVVTVVAIFWAILLVVFLAVPSTSTGKPDDKLVYYAEYLTQDEFYDMPEDEYGFIAADEAFTEEVYTITEGDTKDIALNELELQSFEDWDNHFDEDQAAGYVGYAELKEHELHGDKYVHYWTPLDN